MPQLLVTLSMSLNRRKRTHFDEDLDHFICALGRSWRPTTELPLLRSALPLKSAKGHLKFIQGHPALSIAVENVGPAAHVGHVMEQVRAVGMSPPRYRLFPPGLAFLRCGHMGSADVSLPGSRHD